MSKVILGLDISSCTIGCCALKLDDNKISLLALEYIKPPKTGHIIERLAKTKEKVVEFINKVKPDYIGIEDILYFMKGRSQAATTLTLSVFNRMVGLCAYEYLKSTPSMFSVMTVRSGIKINSFPKKEDIPDLIATHLGIKFPYIKNKKGVIIIENYDMADACAVALYHAFLLTGKVKPKKPTIKKRKKTKK
jgi:Holliday junction resolvasome RuvABC endonuclease subunit